MVVTRRTPVVPQPPLARNPSSRGVQRPPRASLAKDTAGASKNAASSSAAASQASSSDGDKDHRNGLVSLCLLRKLKLFKSLSLVWTPFEPLILLNHIPAAVRLHAQRFYVLNLKAHPCYCRTTTLCKRLKSPGDVAR